MLNIIFMARFWLDLRRNHFKLIFSRLFEICGIGIISFCLYFIGVIKWWRMKLGNNFTSIPLYYGWKIVHQSIPAAPSPPPPGGGHLAFARGWGISKFCAAGRSWNWPIHYVHNRRFLTCLSLFYLSIENSNLEKVWGLLKVWLKFRSFRQNTC